MPPPFNPVVQDGDRARIVRAHGEMFEAKGNIYGFHATLLKVAGMTNSPRLRTAASAWLDHSDMIVSTSFDIDHLEAQIKDRVARGLNQFVPELRRILGEVQARHNAAVSAVERAEHVLEDEYIAVVPRERSKREREKVREVFDRTVRGRMRPRNLPKARRRRAFSLDFEANARFGMRLRVRGRRVRGP